MRLSCLTCIYPLVIIYNKDMTNLTWAEYFKWFWSFYDNIWKVKVFKRQPHKMVRHTKTILRNSRRIVWGCLNILWGWHFKDWSLTETDLMHLMRGVKSFQMFAANFLSNLLTGCISFANFKFLIFFVRLFCNGVCVCMYMCLYE